MIFWTVLGAVVTLAIIFTIAVYNRLISLKNRFKNAFAQIDVQLQRRHDLIPNLVETAKRYMQHEQDTLTQVTEARNQASSAKEAAKSQPDDGNAVHALGKAESALSGSLANFMAVAENYPDLKANETMSQLMEELSSTENRIGSVRQLFNDAIMNYNTYREQFPNIIVATKIGSFEAAELLQIENPEARERVDVNF